MVGGYSTTTARPGPSSRVARRRRSKTSGARLRTTSGPSELVASFCTARRAGLPSRPVRPTGSTPCGARIATTSGRSAGTAPRSTTTEAPGVPFRRAAAVSSTVFPVAAPATFMRWERTGRSCITMALASPTHPSDYRRCLRCAGSPPMTCGPWAARAASRTTTARHGLRRRSPRRDTSTACGRSRRTMSGPSVTPARSATTQARG